MGVGDRYDCVVYGQLHTGDWQTTAMYETDVSIGSKEAEMEALVDALEEHWTGNLIFNDALDFMSGNGSVEGISIRDKVNPQKGLDRVFTTPKTGSMSGDGLPSQDSFYVKKLSANVGKSGQGGRYLPFGAESTQNGGIWTTSVADDILAWCADGVVLVGPLALNLFSEKIWSGKLGFAFDVIGYAASLLVASQIRRRS